MKKTYFELVLSGVGGQGTVSSGDILGSAASTYDDKFAVMTCTYGVSARGGFAKSDVLIGDRFINYYEAVNPDVILVLSDKAYPMIKDKIKEDTLVIINTDEVKEYDEGPGRVFAFPLSKMAYELGFLQGVNMIALGFIVRKTQVVKEDALKRAVNHRYPGEKASALNMKAVEKGFELAGSK